MKIKAVLLDFDGTIVEGDLLAEVCGIVGKRDDAIRIDREVREGKWQGIEGLKTRINFLNGVKLSQIENKLNSFNCLIDGVEEFIVWLNKNNISSFIISGNLIPILQYYQKKLGVTEVFGKKLLMNGDEIIGFDESNNLGKDYKKKNIELIFQKYGLNMNECVAIGDSPVDKGMFDMASLRFGMKPKIGVENLVDYVVDDYWKIIEIIKNKNLK